MAEMDRLHLQDALEDSPQTRSLRGIFEQDAMVLKKYTSTLHNCCQRVLHAQHELSAATRSFSHHLKVYQNQKFPLESDNSILTSTLKQFTSYLDEISSMQQILATQLGDGMMYPLSKFLQADLEEVTTMYEMYKIATQEHEQAITKHMKLPKKRDNERLRLETNEELYLMRKKFHQTALHYYSSLNALQYKRKYALLEPLLGYMHAQRAFFEMGHQAVGKTEIGEFLSNINASVQGVHQELSQETQKTVELIDSIEKQSAHLYHAEPPSDMPYIPPNTNVTNKAGYLFLRSKQALIATKWERCYFFINGGNLMCQHKAEVAGSLLLDLNDEGIYAVTCEQDDRRFVFEIAVTGAKKSVILQAENEREREEWVAAINNTARDGGYVKDKHQPKKKERTPSSSSQDGSVKSRSATSDAVPVPRKESSSRDSSAGRSPSTPSSAPPDNFIPDVPIQFDMISPNDETKSFKPYGREGPPRRINPFDQSSVDIVSDNVADNAAFCQMFEVRFLGSMEVKQDRGEELVHETIRQIMAARAIHNVFKTTESHLVVSSECMRLVDPSNNTIRTEFQLEDISYWAAHNENKRLLGFITRAKPETKGAQASFACHVFECNASGEEICHAISTATKLAFQALMEKKAHEKQRAREKQILLANIQQLEDAPDEPRVGAEGKLVMIGNNNDQSEASSESADVNPPIVGLHERGDGDERKVEGAECESEA